MKYLYEVTFEKGVSVSGVTPRFVVASEFRDISSAFPPSIREAIVKIEKLGVAHVCPSITR